jgi:cytochrome c553
VHATWPNLAGQDKQYLATQLKAYRDGTRQSAMMYPMAFDLTDEDIDDIADYFHQLKCK